MRRKSASECDSNTDVSVITVTVAPLGEYGGHYAGKEEEFPYQFKWQWYITESKLRLLEDIEPH